MTDGLRDALEKLCTRLWADAANNGTDVRHPRVVLENRARDVEKMLASLPAEPVGVSDEARGAGLAALHADNDWHKSDGGGVWRANYKRAVDLVLEAAQPFMQTQVVASRERVVEVLTTHRIECTGPGEVTCRDCRDKGWMSWSAYRQHVADALLAAGVFRELPTRDGISELLLAKLVMLDETHPDASAVERCRAQADAVLNLLGGAAE